MSVASYGVASQHVRGYMTLEDCTFTDNVTGALCSSDSTGVVKGCTFDHNGEALLITGNGTVGDVQDCRFFRNTMGLHSQIKTLVNVVNGLFVGNGTGLMSNSASYNTVQHCTFTRNAPYGYYSTTDGGATFTECILWGNATDAYTPSGSYINFWYSLSNNPKAISSQANFYKDPLFVRNASAGGDGTWGTPDDDLGDLHLQPTSPCVNTGGSFDGEPAADLDGAPRVRGGFPDMGVYELPFALASVTPNTALVNRADLSITLVGTGFSKSDVVYFNGSPVTTKYQTAAKLLATVPAAAMTAVGVYNVDVRVAGETTNALPFYVQNKTSLSVTSVTGPVGSNVNFKATLKSGTTPLSGRTINFRVDGTSVGTATTDGFGVATLPHTVTESTGDHVLKSEFGGEAAYAASTATGKLTVKPLDTKLSVTSVTATYGASVNLKAVLKVGTTPLSGQSVTFKVDGGAVGTVTTDVNGLASLPHTVTESLGTHALTAEYAGDGATYGPSTRTGTLKVQSAMKIAADVVSAPAGSPVPYGAKLTRTIDNAPLDGRTLSFYAGTTLLGTGTTDVNGRATVNLTAPAAGVKQTITVKYAGEALYKATGGTGSMTGT